MAKEQEWYEYEWRRWRSSPSGHYHERDQQRQRCYDAESSYITVLKANWGAKTDNDYLNHQYGPRKNRLRYTGDPDGLQPTGRIDEVEDMQAWVDKIMSRAWFKRRWPHMTGRKVEVRDGRGRRAACGSYRGGYIKMPTWSRSRVIILHELGHAITPYETGGGHGRYWARTFIELVWMVLGEDYGKLLRKMFRLHGAKYTPKRRLSPEVREAARKRFIDRFGTNS